MILADFSDHMSRHWVCHTYKTGTQLSIHRGANISTLSNVDPLRRTTVKYLQMWVYDTTHSGLERYDDDYKRNRGRNNTTDHGINELYVSITSGNQRVGLLKLALNSRSVYTQYYR